MASYVVGYHWFEYADEPAEGRFDGENSNFGVVNIEDDPYQERVDQMTVSNLWPCTLRADAARNAGPDGLPGDGRR